MNLVSIKPPTVRIALPGEAFELFDTLLRIITTGQFLKVVADQLIQALTQCLGLLSGAGNGLFVDG